MAHQKVSTYIPYFTDVQIISIKANSQAWCSKLVFQRLQYLTDYMKQRVKLQFSKHSLKKEVECQKVTKRKKLETLVYIMNIVLSATSFQI